VSAAARRVPAHLRSTRALAHARGVRRTRHAPRRAPIVDWASGAALVFGLSLAAPPLARAAPSDAASAPDGSSDTAAAPAEADASPGEQAPALDEDARPREGPEPELEPDNDDEPADDADGEPTDAAAKPPRISGIYLGMTLWPALSWALSPNLEIDQSAVIPGGGGALRLGQAVFPWLTIGVDASGGFYFNKDTFFTKGGLLIEFGFYPVPRYPFSIRTGFGFGAGLIIDDRAEDYGGVGGPRFMGSLRYEFFPQAERKRPKRPGGWVVGPEIGWRGFTPAAKGRPMSNTLLLGIWFGYYWGK